MIDEGTLRERFPEIPWDEPVKITVLGNAYHRWVCRYCIAMEGLKAREIDSHKGAFLSREAALNHVEEVHHD